MKKIIILLIVGVIAWKGYARYENYGVVPASEEALAPSDVIPEREPERAVPMTPINYQCDGRVHCSQMTSCEEATFFLKNCPGVKMDGGQSNGIPCESQWCK